LIEFRNFYVYDWLTDPEITLG